MNFRTLFSGVAAITAAASLSACVVAPVTPGTTTGGTTTNSVAQLQSGEWVVQSISGKAVTTEMKPTLNFGQTFQLTGNTSCNSYFSGYLVTGSALLLKNAGVTKMACEPSVMAVEDRFLAQLNQTQMWRIQSDGSLILEGPSGNIIAKRR